MICIGEEIIQIITPKRGVYFFIKGKTIMKKEIDFSVTVSDEYGEESMRVKVGKNGEEDVYEATLDGQVYTVRVSQENMKKDDK